MEDKNPEQVAWDEAKGHGIAFARYLLDHGRRYLTAALGKFAVVGGAGVVLAWISFPIAAAVGCSIAVGGGLIYGVYGRRLYYDERGSRRWTWIAAKRLDQQRLRTEQAADAAVFAVMGRPVPTAGYRPPELAAAIAAVRHRAIVAAGGQALNVRGAQRAAPEGPNLDAVKRRMDARAAKIEALESEIQSLAVPENVEAAMRAEDARRHEKSASESARQADQAARERIRRGQTATQPDQGISMSMRLTPTGVESVSSVPPKPTPEQIAAGRGESDREGST